MSATNVYVVSEQLDHDGEPVRGVFESRKAAREYIKLRKKIDRFDDYVIDRWKIENIADVKLKFESFQKKRKR